MSTVGQGLATGDHDRDQDVPLVENNGSVHLRRKHGYGSNLWGGAVIVMHAEHKSICGVTGRCRPGAFVPVPVICPIRVCCIFGFKGVQDSLFVHWTSGQQARVYDFPINITIDLVEDES